MAIATIGPGGLSGTIEAISSKSHLHRILILAALADGTTRIRMRAFSQDIDATIGCLERMGAKVVRTQQGVTVTPIREPKQRMALDCNESGTTLRLLLPVAAALCPTASFNGRGRLPQRPLGELVDCLQAHGVTFDQPHLPLLMQRDTLQGGVFEIPGNVSSQYISGLLMMLPLLEKGGEIRLTTPLSSAGYVDMTIDAMRSFGVEVIEKDGRYLVPGGQRYRTPGSIVAEGDWSNAAFFLAAGALGGPVTVTGLSAASLQRDKNILEILVRWGANVSFNSDSVTVAAGSPRKGIAIDLGDIPDLAPILSILSASAQQGVTVMRQAARLRLKESDRVKAILQMLEALGIMASAGEDHIAIPAGRLKAGRVDSQGDHRIAMSAAIAATAAGGPVEIVDPLAVNKSYPAFYEDFMKLGGTVHGI